MKSKVSCYTMDGQSVKLAAMKILVKKTGAAQLAEVV